MVETGSSDLAVLLHYYVLLCPNIRNNSFDLIENITLYGGIMTAAR